MSLLCGVVTAANDSARPGTVIAATSNALLFRSADSGDFWARLHFPAKLRATLHALAIDARTGTYLRGWRAAIRDTPVFLSAEMLCKPGPDCRHLPGKEICSIAIYPTNPRVIAADGVDGVYLTLDGRRALISHIARIQPSSHADCFDGL